MRNLLLLLALVSFMSSGCQPAPAFRGQLGFSDARRLVVIGENVRPDIVAFYEKEYSALVWSTPYEGKMSSAATKFVNSVIGPTAAMRSLIAQLKSINDTVGRWEIIVPKIGEKYFLTALKHMHTGGLARARGMVVLLDSSGMPEMEREVQRVTDGNFFVAYEFQKDLK
jgi:hypothetical protein